MFCLYCYVAHKFDGYGTDEYPKHRYKAVVETDGATWLALATGRLSWERALADGALHASGERCDISSHLPLMRA